MPDPIREEQDRRRRDIGSGISLELLNTQILDFIFSPHIKIPLLGSYAGILYEDQEYYVDWETDFGVGSKGDSNELIFLCTAGNFAGVLTDTISDYMATESLSQTNVDPEFFNNLKKDTIASIGPNIILATCDSYKASQKDKFIEDHIITKKKRLFSQSTIETNQTKTIALSYYVGTENTYDELPSHPNSMESSIARAIENNKNTKGPFKWVSIMRDIAGI
jgi:hypothetical protein